MSEPIKVVAGKTCVKVMRIDIDERTKRERTIQAHEGIVVQDLGSFIRVYNPAPLDKGGDVSPETSQCYPVLAKRMWCEVTSTKTVAFPIPAALRF